jgi:dipeptidyl aminopeptidase/acylaminoacyl peptidase
MSGPMKHTKKKKKKKISRFLRLEHFIYFLVIYLGLTFVWWLVGLNYVNHRSLSGGSAGDSPSAQFDYKSLDLSRVRRANFSDQPIEQLSALTSDTKTRQYIFSFGVPHDNLTEKGLLVMPTSPAPKSGYPVLILCHGYANPWVYSTEKAYLGDMHFYASHGFAVLKPDYRGQGLSIPDGQPEGAYYSMAYNTDVMSLIAAIKQTPYLDKSKINIWGHSMGAYVALRAAVVSKDIKNAILLSGPVGSFPDMYKAYVAISDTQNPTAANIRLDVLNRYGTPLTNSSFWNKASPLSYLSDTKAKIQIHVGTDDLIVPPQLSADLDQALTTAHKKHEYYVYYGGTHGLGAERTSIWPRSLDLISSKD